MLALALWASLAAFPKLAAPGLSCAGIPPSTCGAFSEHLAQQLGERNVPVSAAADIEAVLGQERQKQLLGCEENSSSCSAEIANALGVDAIVRGSLAKVGKTVIVNVRVISSSNAQTLATFSESTDGLESVPEALERAAAHIASQLNVGATAAPSNLARPAVLIPAGVAVASGIGAGITFALAGQAAGELRAPQPNDYDPRPTLARGQLMSTMGVVLSGVAGAALITAGVMYFVNASAPSSQSSGHTTPAMAVTPQGTFFTLTGVWP